MTTLIIVIRLYLGGILLTAGFLKILNRMAFAQALTTYQMLPRRWVPELARLLPVVEVALGICLVSGRLVPWPEIAAAGLFSLFTLAVALSLLTGKPVAGCGCGLPGFKKTGRIGPRIILRNLFLVAVALAAAGSEVLRLRALSAGALLLIAWLFVALAARQHSAATPLASAKPAGD